MGDLQICSPRLNGNVFSEDRLNLSSPSSTSSSLGSSPPLPVSHPDPSLIAEECWGIAEETTRCIIRRIRPTLLAEQKRAVVIDYVQRLLRGCIGCEVFAYGSVPLKTYLPDGDIDLTAISSPNIEDALVSDVHAALICEEHNQGAQYEVKDVHYIDAEVKLVKCIIENIVVDISFNQLGGLCTLCFLEQVDRVVGKDHLFKRSIILIKDWCYYESRILGAHHGLISTYALETLVLYIFHVFHSSLDGPLSVLYRFLDYFSKFDWDNYCISLNGPVCKSSLPEIVVEVPENGGDDLLLSQEFLRNCVDMFSVPARGVEANSRVFPLKHLNIIDPLRESNNLGRSVNKGNFFRIRSAFKYGARKLGWILLLPRERTATELNKFFANTLDRHGSRYENCVQTYALAGDSGYGMSASPTGLSSLIASRSDFDSDRTVSQYCLAGDAKEHPTSNGVLNRNLHTSLSWNSHHFSNLFRENGKIKSGMLATGMSDDENNFTLGLESAVVSNSPRSYSDQEGRTSVDPVIPGPVSNGFRNSCHGFREWGPEVFESLVELNGDHDNHIRCLQYGQHCHGYTISVPIVRTSHMPFHIRNKNSWETIHQSIQLKQNVSSRMNKNCGVSGPQLHSVNSFGLEEKTRQRGTGTYIPNLNYRSSSERPLQVSVRNQARGMQTQLQKQAHNSCSPTFPSELNSSDESSHELSQAEFPFLGNRKSISPDSYRSNSSKWGPSHTNGIISPTQNLEFGSRGPQPEAAAPVTESSTSPNSPMAQTVVSPKSEPDKIQERIVELSFQLKDEDDFPPLSL